MLSRLPCPPWFLALITLAYVGLAHAFGLHELEWPDLRVAWFAFLIPIATWIWNGIQVAGKITLAALNYAVIALKAFAQSTYSAVLGLGRNVLGGFHKAWGFLKGLYVDLLAPAWRKFWRFVDAAQAFLERIFRPILRVLFRIRQIVLDVYDRFVRPVLDTIDAARRALGILSSLGVEWARRLDDQLAKLQDRINAPFLLVLRKLNEVVNVINRITTADGLFQRLALVRSLVRDVRYVQAMWWRFQVAPLTAEERARRGAEVETPTPALTVSQTRELVTGRSEELPPLMQETLIEIHHALGLR